MQASDFLKMFVSWSQFPGAGKMLVPPLPAKAQESSSWYLIEKQNVLENISSDLAILFLIQTPKPDIYYYREHS